MTVAVGTGRSTTWVADGANRNWDFPFKALSASHIRLVVTDPSGTKSIVTEGFTVVGINSDDGGTVTYPLSPTTPLPAGYKVQVRRFVPFSQPNRIGNQGGFHAETHERTFDLLAMQVQQLNEDGTARGLTAPSDDGVLDMRLPRKAARAGKLLEFDADGRPTTKTTVADIKAYADSRSIVVPGAAEFSSRALAAGSNIPAIQTFVRVGGYAIPGDGGSALYARVGSEPAHPGKFQSADGGWWELRESKPTPFHFGGKDDGATTDDTAAFNALFAYCEAFKRPGYIPATKNGFATNGGHTAQYGLIGEGEWKSLIRITHPTNTILRSTNPEAPSFDGVWYLAAVTRTAGYTIQIDGPAGQLVYKPTIRNNTFQGGWVDIGLTRANIASVEGNFSTDFGNHFLEIQNIDFPDNGDHSIVGNVWDTSRSAQAGIMQYDAGGARIQNNKGGRGAFGYELVLTGVPADSTSILIIDGNSFENQTVGQVRLRRFSGATATFRHVIITDNEFAGSPAGNASVSLDDGQDFITNLVVSGNVIQFTGTAISATAAKNIMVEGNVFESFGGASVGITTGANAEGLVGLNEFKDVTTPIANASANVRVARWSQSGTQSVAATGAYGSLFSGSVAVNFPTPFTSQVDVLCYPESGSGIVSASAQNMTITGFSLRAISVTSGTVGCRWIAFGY